MTSRRGTMWLTETLIILACLAAEWTLEARAAPVASETEAVRYLSQFGYLPAVNPKTQPIISEEAFTEAISEFQSFVGINVTGNMDVETAYMMSLPRCGVRDKVRDSEGDRSKRYALFGGKWDVKSLTYRITKYPGVLDQRTIDHEIARALAVWSDYTDLTFTPSSGEIDIEIRFETGDHGDGSPLDGPGNTLAHAFSPGAGLGGDAHFDELEVWTVNSYEGVNLFQVAAHEFGHSLGLDHSQIRDALMAPVYRKYEPNFKLHYDDITAIQELYGPKTEDRPGVYDGQDSNDIPDQTIPDQNIPDICTDPQIDTIFYTEEGYVYVFKGEYYWRLATDGIDAGYPKLISTGWSGLPNNIDATFTDANGWTHFFKGSEYWVFRNGQPLAGYPRKIYKDFPGTPNDIDAAMVSSRDGQIHFYKGDKFWRFNPSQSSLLKRRYSEPISSSGVPKNLDAALSYSGSTYFFKGGAFYLFNDRTFTMDPASPSETGPTWFGCSKENNDVPWGNQW